MGAEASTPSIQMGVGEIAAGITPHAMLGDALGLSSDKPECKIVPIPFLEQLSLLRQSPRRGWTNGTNAPAHMGLQIRQMGVR